MRRGLCAAVLMVLAGCRAFSLDIDGQIAQRAIEPVDLAPPVNMRATFALGPALQVESEQKEGETKEKEKTQKTMMERLKLAEGLPGANTPDIRMPPANSPRAEIEAAVKKQFPPLPAVPKLPVAKPGPAGTPYTLSDLQQIALATSPLIRQAHLNVDAARGQALQAGLYPNPVIGYEGSTIGQGQTPGQQGGFIEQTIKTNGKLNLARGAALAEVQIAETHLRQVESDVQTQVRLGYFAVLAARTQFDVIRALVQSTDDLYNVLLMQMRAGEVAAYEPMQIRVLALQARGQLVLAHNRYIAAWKQLAATLSSPALPLTALAGRLDTPLPHFEYDQALDQILSNHTEVIVAGLGVDKARLLARLAEAQPFPDVNVHVAFQKDYTQAPFGAVANISVGVPVPFWDRNQGNIQQTRALLQRALQEHERVRNELTSRTAAAFERYENNRSLLDLYKQQILPNQVQAFRAAVARHAAVGDKSVSYNDLVTAQQALASMVNSYLAALGDQWIAAVDLANLLQTRDLFQIQRGDEVAPIPDVREILREEILPAR
jgi:outer membrane protein, heavy metal efflux system